LKSTDTSLRVPLSMHPGLSGDGPLPFGYLWPVFFYLAIRADPDGGSDNALNDFAIHFLLPECPVIGHYFFSRIAQKREGEVVLL